MNRRNFIKLLFVQASIFALEKNSWGAQDKKKKIILTIDDGPRKNMESILEDLGYENPCIFYLIGMNTENRFSRELAKRAIKNGHILGNHSYTHPKFSKISLKSAKREIEKTESILKGIYEEVGFKKQNKLFRFPYGDENTEVKKYLKEEGYTLQRWDFDSNDWRYYSKERPLRLDSIVSGCLKIKEKDIVLVHDLPITKTYLVPFIVHSNKYQPILPESI